MSRRRPREPLTGPTKGAASGRGAIRTIVLSGLGLITALVIALAAWRWLPPSFADRLPSLPDLTRQSQAVRDQLTAADAAARASSRSPEVVGALCTSYHSTMLYKEAIACYGLMTTLAPGDWIWPYSRGLAWSAVGQDEEAARDFVAAVEVAPALGQAWWRLGAIAFKQGQIDLAEGRWQRAAAAPATTLSRDGANEASGRPSGAAVADAASVSLARVALARGDAGRARHLLEALATRSPESSPVHRLLGESLAALGETAAAADAIRRADRLPSAAMFSDPAVDRLVGHSKHALFLLQRAAELGPTHPGYEAVITRALQFNPEHPEVLYAMSGIRRRQARHAEALEYLRRYQRLTGDDLVFAEIGSYLFQLGQLDEAEAMLRRALQGPPNANVAADLGALLVQRERPVEAIALFERALAIDPFHASARLNLAAFLLLERRFDRAARHLELVIKSEPDNAKAHANLGVALEEQGRLEEAAAHYRQALRIEPGMPVPADRLRALRSP